MIKSEIIIKIRAIDTVYVLTFCKFEIVRIAPYSIVEYLKNIIIEKLKTYFDNSKNLSP